MIEVIVPWRGGCPDRERALAWASTRYPSSWRLTLARCPDGPWVKALAVKPALEHSRADVVVVADADVWCEATADAVQAVRDGAPWAKPHGYVYRLTQDATADVLAGAPPHKGMPVTRDPYRGLAGGGIVVAPRSTLLDVPLDPRFEGWGGEDASWGWALNALAGPAWRGEAPLCHLWHPPQDKAGKWGSDAARALAHRYDKARRTGTLHDLIREAHESYPTAIPTLHDRSPAGVR